MSKKCVSGLSGVGAKKRCVTVSASHPLPPSSSTRTGTLRWSWHVLVYASNCIQTYPPPLHCFVLVYVSNCRVGIAAALFAFGPFMTRPLCSRLNITVAKPTLPYPTLPYSILPYCVPGSILPWQNPTLPFPTQYYHPAKRGRQ